VLDSGERGRVTHIGLRSTSIETRDEVRVTVPNSIIANARIKNESRPLDRERVRISIELSYGVDAAVVKQLLVEAAGETEHVLEDPAPRARLSRVADRGLTFDLLCWIDDPVARGHVYDAVITAAYRKLLQAGIDALPTKHEIVLRDLPRELAEVLGEIRSAQGRAKSFR
jgi:small-conductance mechanosensitive channel